MWQKVLPFVVYQWGRLKQLGWRHQHQRNETELLRSSSFDQWNGLESFVIHEKGILPGKTGVTRIIPILDSNPSLVLLISDSGHLVSMLELETGGTGTGSVVDLTPGNLALQIPPESSFLYASVVENNTVQILIKETHGIAFYSFKKGLGTTGEFKLLGMDYMFSNLVSWEVLKVGKFSLDGSITLLSRQPSKGVQLWALCAPIDPKADAQFCAGDDFKVFPSSWSSTKDVWTTPGFGGDKNGLIWSLEENSESLVAYRIDIDGNKAIDVGRVRLPRDAIVGNVIQLGSQNLVVSLLQREENEEDGINLVFETKDGGKAWAPVSLLFTENAVSSQGNVMLERERFASIDDGPTIQFAKSGNNLLNHEQGVIWPGPLLSSVSILPLPSSNGMIILGSKQDASISWFTVEEKTIGRTPFLSKDDAGSSSSFLPLPRVEISTVKKLVGQNPITFSILDALPSSIFVNALNLQTGGLQFSLPFIPEINFSLDYRGGSQQLPDRMNTPLLGQSGDWSIGSVPAFIAMTPGSSGGINKATAIYFLFLHGNMVLLEEISQNENLNSLRTRTFKVKSSNQKEPLILEYLESTETWTLRTGPGNDTIFEFGGRSDGIKWGWREGSWCRTDGKIAIEWFIKAIKTPSLTSSFSYREIEGKEPDPKASPGGYRLYSKSLLLTKYTTFSPTEGNGQVDFDYGEEGRLNGWKLNLAGRRQDVRLGFDEDGKMSRIEQKIDGDYRNMIQFGYEENYGGLLSWVEIPSTGFRADWRYKRLEVASPGEKSDFVLELDDPTSSTEPNLAVVHNGMNSFFDNGMSLWTFNAQDGSKTAIDSRYYVHPVSLAIKNNTLIRLTKNTPNDMAQLSIYSNKQKGNNWTLISTRNDYGFSSYPRFKLLQSGLLVKALNSSTSSSTLTVEEWTGAKWETRVNLNLGPEFPALERDLLISDDRIVWKKNNSTVQWIWKGIKDQWWGSPKSFESQNSKSDTDYSSPHQCSSLFRSIFDLGSELERNLTKMFDPWELQMDGIGKGFLVHGCTLSDTSNTIGTTASLYEWDEWGNVIPNPCVKIQKERENLLTLSQKQDVLQKGNLRKSSSAVGILRSGHPSWLHPHKPPPVPGKNVTVTFTYKKQTNAFPKFVLHVSAQGYESQEVKINEDYTKQNENATAKGILWEPYNLTMIALTPDRIISSNDTEWILNTKGEQNGWKEMPWDLEELKKDAEKRFAVDLGRNWKLERAVGNGSIVLKKNFMENNVVLDFGNNVTRVHNILDEKTVVVFTQRISGTGIENNVTRVLDEDETYFNSHSSPQFLVTKRNSTEKIRIEWTGWLPGKPAVVIDRLEIKGLVGETLNLPRVTQYEYNNPILTQDRNLAWRNNTVIKGQGSKTKQGWTTYSFDEKSGIMGRVYDGQGQLLKQFRPDVGGSETEKADQKPNQDADLKKKFIFDNTDSFIITQLSPYNSTECQVAFTAFQPYESNNWGGECGWNFNQSLIIHGNGDSLTGSNYLHLKNLEVLSFSLPLVKDQSYAGGCWIRTASQNVNNPLESPILTAWVKDTGVGFMSRNILTRGSSRWRYLQVKVKAEELLPLWTSLLGKNRNELNHEGMKLEFKVESDQVDQSGIHVDSCLIAPTPWNQEVKIYDQETGRITENVIGATGLIVHTIFDEIDGDGILETDPLGLINFINLSIEPNQQGVTTLLKVESIDKSGYLQTFGNTSSTSGFTTFGRFGVLHQGDSPSRVEIFNSHSPEPDRLVIRFRYNLVKVSSSLTFKFGGRAITLTLMSNDTASITLSGKSQPIPALGTLFIASLGRSQIVVFSKQRILFLYNSIPKTNFGVDFTAQGSCIINQVVVLPNPSISVVHSNQLGEEVQSGMLLEDGYVITETLYDDQGRIVAKTKPTLLTWNDSDETMLQYRPKWVTSFNLENQEMTGEIIRYNSDCGEVPFTSVQYWNSPLNEETKLEGRSGTLFSSKGQFAISYSRDTVGVIPSVQVLFPSYQGFNYRTKTVGTSGFTTVSVFKSLGKGKDVIFAKFQSSPGGAMPSLVTYDYDDKSQLIAMLPPMHHLSAQTLLKGKTWAELNVNNNKNTAPYGTFYDYNEKGQLIRKVTPEQDAAEYFYDVRGNVINITNKSRDLATTRSTKYFEYEDGVNLNEMGILNGTNKLPSKIIKKLGQINGPLTTTDMIVNYHYFTEKGTANATAHFVQRGLPHGMLTSETGLSWTTDLNSEPLFTPKTRFSWTQTGKRMLKLHYAVEATTLMYSYNAMGRVSKIHLIKDGSDAIPLANFDYSAATGGLSKEILHQHSGLLTAARISSFTSELGLSPITTMISYNAPSFPYLWENEFVREELNYIEGGYGDVSTGEPAYPSSLNWTAKYTNPIKITNNLLHNRGIHPTNAELCTSALVKAGYISTKGDILRLFVSGLELESVPLICNSGESGKTISKIFVEVLGLKGHGYSFQYGNYKELLKSKFISLSDEQQRPYCTQPQTISSLAQSLGISSNISNLWDSLVRNGFIIIDSEKGRTNSSQAEPGNQSLYARNSIQTSLEKTVSQNDAIIYTEPLGRMLGSRVGKKLEKTEFSTIFQTWQTRLTNQTDIIADHIYKMMIDQQYVTETSFVTSKSLASEFIAILEQFDKNLDVSKVFSTFMSWFKCGIKSTAGDTQVYKIDVHGNMELFYNGQDRLELTYKQGTNQLQSSTINLLEETKYGHDHHGNLNSITKSGKVVLELEYDLLSNLPTRIQLDDGRELRLLYDWNGERVAKKLYSKDGILLKEIRYLGRDPERRVLTDQVITYFGKSGIFPKIVTTSYFYGIRGLIGFQRNGVYYSVLVDRIGSPRVVLKNGEVVAAYTYLPYGKLLSKWEQPGVGGSLRYLFTGQELDDETGLYNFHFRMYDPLLARFYQIDPKSQYFNPYMYAGNAPLLQVDPDGRYVWLAVAVILAIAGFFLGGAAANEGVWNPANWNWKSWRTYLGAFGGAVGGFFIPLGFLGTMGVIAVELVEMGVTAGLAADALAATITTGLGLIVSFVGTGNSINWKFENWNFKSAGTWNSLLQGFGLGSGFIGGVSSYLTYMKTFGMLGRVVFKVGSILTAATLGYLGGADANNDWNPKDWKKENNAATLWAVTSGVAGGFTLPAAVWEVKLKFSNRVRSGEMGHYSPRNVEYPEFALKYMERFRRWLASRGNYSPLDVEAMQPLIEMQEFGQEISSGVDVESREISSNFSPDPSVTETDRILQYSRSARYEALYDLDEGPVYQSDGTRTVTVVAEIHLPPRSALALMGNTFDEVVRTHQTKLRYSLREGTPSQTTGVIIYIINKDLIMLQILSQKLSGLEGGLYILKSSASTQLFSNILKSNPASLNQSQSISEAIQFAQQKALEAYNSRWGNSIHQVLQRLDLGLHAGDTEFKMDVENRLKNLFLKTSLSLSQHFRNKNETEIVTWIISKTIEGSFIDTVLNPVRLEMSSLENGLNQSFFGPIQSNLDQKRVIVTELLQVLGGLEDKISDTVSAMKNTIVEYSLKDLPESMLPLLAQSDGSKTCSSSWRNGHDICFSGSAETKVDGINYYLSGVFKDHQSTEVIQNSISSTQSENNGLYFGQWMLPDAFEPQNDQLLSIQEGLCFSNSSWPCDINEKETKNRRKRSVSQLRRDEPVPVSSSASSSLGANNFITHTVKLLKGFWKTPISQKMNNKIDIDNQDESFNVQKTSHKTRPSSSKPSLWKSCVPWVFDYNAERYVDGMTCTGSKGIVSVTPLKASDETTALTSTHHGDSYSSSQCTFYRDKHTPVGFAHCTGGKTEMLYTAWIDERPFDRVNDQLLLLAMILHFIKVNKISEQEQDKFGVILVSDEDLKNWEYRLDFVQKRLLLCCEIDAKNGGTLSSWCRNWGQYQLDDLREEWNQMKRSKCATLEQKENFEESLEGLCDEIGDILDI